MYDVHSGIKMSSHVEQGNTYSNCFSGELSQLQRMFAWRCWNKSTFMISYTILMWRLPNMKPGHSPVWSFCRFSCGGLDGVHAAGSDPCGGHDAGLGPPGRGFPADRRPEERRGAPHRRPQWAVHGWLHRSVQLCEYEEALMYRHLAAYRWTEMAEVAINPCVKSQSDSLKKRGSVKAETSLSAVEMSGRVIKRGYLLKQVNTLY